MPNIPLHFATNYRDLQESGIEPFLDELADIASGSMDHEPIPDGLPSSADTVKTDHAD
jgi:hypothetical protein